MITLYISYQYHHFKNRTMGTAFGNNNYRKEVKGRNNERKRIKKSQRKVNETGQSNIKKP